jgi:hypothetical protein
MGEKMIKKTIAYIVSYLLYYIGDFFSKITYNKYLHAQWNYDLYQIFMNWSCKVQDWAKNENPWKKPNENGK